MKVRGTTGDTSAKTFSCSVAVIPTSLDVSEAVDPRKEPETLRSAQGDADGVGATRRVAPGDRLPDYVDYSDDGCSLFPSCLNCPLPRCRYDEQAGGRRATTRLRDRELLKERRLSGKSAADLARSFGISKRTVQRIIRRSSSE